MHEKRIRNIFLSIVMGLLLLNLGVMLSQGAPTILAQGPRAGKTQYTGVSVQGINDPNTIVQALNRQSAAGWEYVGEANGILIFKK